MKKIFTMLFAAAAVLAGCSKVDEQKVDPSTPSETSFFYGSIEQPSDPTRTTLDGSNGVQWEVEDMIVAYRLGTSVFKDTTAKMAFHAEKAGCESFFSAKNISAATKFHETFDSFGYDVYFGTDNDSIPCIPSSIASYESGSVRHLPMYAKVAAGVYGPGQREAVFNNVCAVLKVDVSGSLSTMNKLVVTATGDDKIAGKYRMKDSGVEFLDGASTSVTYGCAASDADKVFYIPVKPGEHKLTFTAYEGETPLGEMVMKAAAQMDANTIYPITFVNLEYTISASTTSPFTLPSSTGFVKITATEDISNSLEFTYGGDNHPANVVIDAGGFTISALTITLPDSHVELQNGSSVTVVSQTSATTLDVKKDYKVTESVTIQKGNLTVNGEVKEAIVSDKVNAPITIAIGEGTEAKLETVTNNSSVLTTIDVPQGKDIPEKKGDGPFESPVASIGSTYYSSLKAAADAANESPEAVTITMIDNTTLAAPVVFTNSANMVTLDLNGKTITIYGDNTAEPKVANRISVTNGGQLTITDGSSTEVASQGSIIAADGTKGTSNVVADGGALTIAGGNIISNPANSEDIDAAVYAKNGSTVHMTGGYVRGEGSEGAMQIYAAKNDMQAKKSTLYLSGGKIESNGDMQYSLYIYRSDATISGGEIVLTNATKSGKGAIYSTNEDLATTSFGTIEISDGYIDSKGQYGVYANGVAVNVSGGKIKARKPYFMAGTSESTVSGGEFYNHLYGHYVFYAGPNAKINVTGGKAYATSTTTLTSGDGTIEFSNDVISNKAFIASRVANGWVVDRNVDDTNPEYVFKLAQEDNSITATVDGGTYHCTPAGAQEYVNNSSSAVTLTVEKDFSSDRIYFKKGRENLITLDLNGHTISASDSDQKYLVTSSSSITITDNSNPSTGLVEGVHSAVMVDSTATLTIAGGSFSGDGTYDGGSGVIYTPGTAGSLKIIGGTITCTGTSGADSRAVNIGCDGIMTGGKIISKGSCLRMYTSNTKFTVSGDNTQIISDVDATHTMLVATATGSELRITGGYYYISGPSTSGDSVAFQSNTTRVLVQGGKMNVGANKVTAAAGYKVSALDPSETFEGKEYTYQVEEDTEAEAKAQVNGTNYPSLSDAYNAAMAISDSVTIKLLADATITGRWDFEKAGDKGTCLDLNGKTISTAIDTVFTPKTTLTITSSNSGTKGTITSTKSWIIALNNDAYATVNINNCTITSTSTSTTLGCAILRTSGSATNAAKRIFNIGENAKIIAKRNAIYVMRGVVNVNSNAEITATDDNSYASAIYVYTAAKITISDMASLKAYSVFRSGTSNTATAVTLNGGYFYAAGEKGKIINFNNDYDAKFSFQSGYYNKEVNSTLYPKATIKAAATAITPVSHSHGGESLSYGYQIQ